MRGTFIWSPPRGGNLNSSISLAAARQDNIPPVGSRELRGIGIEVTEDGPVSTSTPKTRRSRSVKTETRTVSGQFTPPGSHTPSTLDREHFEKKAEHLTLARRTASLSSVSTPETLSPLEPALLQDSPSPSGGAATPKTEADDEGEDDEESELKEVEESIAGSPDRTFEASVDQTFILPAFDAQVGTPPRRPSPPVMADPNAQIVGGTLPPPGHRDAPSFTGNAADLSTFLREFEGLKELGWSDAKVVATCSKYVSPSAMRRLFELTEKRWKRKQAPEQTWKNFKADLYDRFPGAINDEDGYDIEALEKHIREAKPEAFRSAVDFQEFINLFDVIAEDLIDRQLMTEAGMNGKLHDAIPLSDVKRTALLKDYLGKKPSDIPWRDFGNKYRQLLETGVTSRDAAPGVKVEVKTETTVKQEPTEAATLMSALSGFADEIRQMMAARPTGGYYENDRGYPSNSLNRPNRSYRPSVPYDDSCAYCADPTHQIRYCHLYRHDAAANGVYYLFRDKRLTVGHDSVRVMPGTHPIAAVREYLGNHYVPYPGQQQAAPQQQRPVTGDTPTTNTGMLSVVSATGSARAVATGASIPEPRIQEWHSDSENEKEEDAAEDRAEVESEDEGMESDELAAFLYTMAQIAQSAGKKVFDGVELPTKKWKKGAEARKSKEGRKAIEAESAADIAQKLAEQTAGKAKEKKEPQYHYEAGTHNPEAQARVLAACKDGCVPMTFGDLLAVSEPLRSKVHQETRRRRVPNSPDQADDDEPEPKHSSIRELAVNELWAMVQQMPITPALSKLMAASDFVRSNMHADTNHKAQAAPENVAQTQTMAMMTFGPGINPSSPRVAIAAKETQLWGINAFVADYHENHEFQLTDVVVDDGSGICAIRSDVAERLQFPYEHSPILCQQFDGSYVKHADLIRNLPVTIGSVRVYIQAYVLPQIGPEMILGGPFEAVVRMGKVTMEDARPVYKFHDPAKADVCIEVIGHVRKPSKEGF